MITYTYSGDDPTYVEQEIWNAGSNTWDNSARSYNTFDSNHNLTEGINQLWNGINDYDNGTRMLRDYNSYSQMIFQTIQNWDGTAWTPFPFDQEFRFYYEEFTPVTTATANVLTDESTIKLYPVPATNLLTIEITGEQSLPYSLSILDMQGRLIKHFGETNNTKRTLSLNELLAGSYILKVTSKGQIVGSKQFAITR